MKPSVLHRLIDQSLHRRLDLLPLGWGLLQQHEKHVLLAVDHEQAAAGTVPLYLAQRSRRRRLRIPRVGTHAKTEPEAETIAREIEIVALDARAGADMVRGHVLEGFGAQVPFAVEFAAIEQHLREAGEVGER